MTKKLLLIPAFLVGAVAAQGQIIFTDSFVGRGNAAEGQYDTSGNPAYIHTQNPSISPFSAAWNVSGGNPENANVGPRLAGDSLSYAGMPVPQGTALQLGRFNASGGTYTNFASRAATPTATSTGAYFGSFMFSMNENLYNASRAANSFFAEFQFQRDPLDGGTVRRLQIGINASNELYMTVVGGTNATVTSTATITGHTATQLIVFQVLDRTNPNNTSGGTTEQITAWLNPDVSTDTSLWTGGLTLDNPLLRTANDVNLFSGLGFQVINVGASQIGTFDEVRLGMDMVSVIPEPSTYAAILGLLALGFVAYRRRLLR